MVLEILNPDSCLKVNKQNINRRILLVDDEQDITFALSIGLEDNGFVVDSFNDPILALQYFKEKCKDNQKNPYDLGLIDVNAKNEWI